MPYIRFGTLALAVCLAMSLTAPAARAQTESPNAPATRANSPQDAALADRVSERLKADPHHLYRHVTVTVTNGVVRLGGQIYSTDAIARAEDIARKTPGVSRVEDQMQLEREAPNTPGH